MPLPTTPAAGPIRCRTCLLEKDTIATPLGIEHVLEFPNLLLRLDQRGRELYDNSVLLYQHVLEANLLLHLSVEVALVVAIHLDWKNK
jgi:hypothetical protein